MNREQNLSLALVQYGITDPHLHIFSGLTPVEGKIEVPCRIIWAYVDGCWVRGAASRRTPASDWHWALEDEVPVEVLLREDGSGFDDDGVVLIRMTGGNAAGAIINGMLSIAGSAEVSRESLILEAFATVYHSLDEMVDHFSAYSTPGEESGEVVERAIAALTAMNGLSRDQSGDSADAPTDMFGGII